MKKVISVILAVIMTLSCFGVVGLAAPVHSFMTESGVEIFMERVLYKSNVYKMQFPSVEDYATKLSSTEGDYAIPGEINDLSYECVFPAGTTNFSCMLSLTGNSDWYGVQVNSDDHAQYWEKDEDGNIDWTQPVSFDRPENTAEQDEYGLLYRNKFYEKGLGGFRDYDKLYWRIEYTCNGEKYTDYFDITLIDFANPDKFTVKLLNYNVAGLPWVGTAANQKSNAEFIVENGYDIVAVQEDFSYHNSLVSGLDGYSYQTHHLGGVPGGDGLNIFTKNMPIYNATRVTWAEAFGVIDHGADEMTPKGFQYAVIDVGNGVYVDFYNLHADAYSDEGSVHARDVQFRQIADYINENYEKNNRPVIVTGDFNVYMHTHDVNSDMYGIFIEECGFKDAWIEVKNDSDYYNMHKWHTSGLSAWGHWDSVERFFYKGTDGVAVVATGFEYIEVLLENGRPASDHSAAECEFTFFKTDRFVAETEELEVTEPTDTGFAYKLEWIFNDLVKVFTHLHEIFTALNRVFTEFIDGLKTE